MVKNTIKTVCNLCGRCGCGMIITLEDRKAVSVQGDPDHPENRGALCQKGQAVIDIVYSPDRLKYPLKRVGKRGDGKWERISWNEALEEIKTKLIEVKENFGPEAVWFHKGAGHDVCSGDIRIYLQRLATVFGTPNVSCPFYICYGPRVLNLFLTTGAIPAPDTENTQCIVLWGINPKATALPRYQKIQKALKRGVQLLVIDPRTTDLSKKANVHLQPLPGSDGALALGMLKIIMNEGLYDKLFVEKWTIGFDDLEIMLEEFTFEKIEELTGITYDQMKKATYLYVKNSPACIFLGNALDQHLNTSQTIRAIAILIAITGNIDIKGGNVILSPGRLAKNPIELFDKITPVMDKKRMGSQFLLSQFEFTKLAHPPSAINAILEEKPYPIKALFVMASNLALTSPNSQKVHKALQKVDFLVVTDIFMSETAKYADIVLPAATFLEQTYYATYDAGADLKPSKPGLLMLRPQVVPPLYESRPDWQIIFDLAKILGYNKFFPWKDIEEAIDYELQPLGITTADLYNQPEGLTIKGPSFLYQKFGRKLFGKFLIRLLNRTKFREYPNMYRKYEKIGFMTDSGKIEIFSNRLQQLGYDPLPIYQVPPDAENHINYPLILTTGAKIRHYIHSQMRNIPRLKKRFPVNLIEVHPTIIEQYNMKDGDIVIVESPKGQISGQLKATTGIHPQVIHIYHGFNDTNVNILTDTFTFDPICGSAPLRSLCCKITRVT